MPPIMLKIIGKLALLAVLSVNIGVVSTGIWVAHELKGGPAKIQLRELTNQEKWRLHLYEETLRVGLPYKDFRILKKIAQAESHFEQYDENGSVLRGFINHKDVGIFQINEHYHLAASRELGINIYEPDGNIDYAVYLYKRDGSVHWNWSKQNWSK